MDILELLPSDSIVAQIPVEAIKNKDPKTMMKIEYNIIRRQGVIVADTDGDGIDEMVVAYYKGHKPFFTKEGEETDDFQQASKENPLFFRRATVCILKKTGDRWGILWKSDSWGMDFGCQMVNEPKEDKILLSEYSFQVKDLNGDLIPEILFSRRSFNAEGYQAEIWTWDKEAKRYRNIFTTSGTDLTFENMGTEHCNIVSKYYYSGKYGEVRYRWDKEEKRFVLIKNSQKFTESGKDD